MNTLQYCIDKIDLQKQADGTRGVMLYIAGWIFDSASVITQIAFYCDGEEYPLKSFGAISPDVTHMFGEVANNCRFEETIERQGLLHLNALSHARFRVTYSDGTSVELSLGGPFPWSWAAPRGDFSTLKAHIGIIASDPEEASQQLDAIANLSSIAHSGVVVGKGNHEALEKLAHAYNWHYLPQNIDSIIPSSTVAAFYLRYILDSDIVIILNHGLPEAQNWDRDWILGALSFGSLISVEKEEGNNKPGADGTWWRPYRIAAPVDICCLACSRTDLDFYGLPNMRAFPLGATARDDENSFEFYALSGNIRSLKTSYQQEDAMPLEQYGAFSPQWRTELQSLVMAVSEPKYSSLSPEVNSSDQDLFSRFISFGDNCEFGLIQRKIGLETLDLLRFGGTGESQDGLLRALKENFGAFGTPEDTNIYDLGGEWISASKHYGVTFHTHRHVANTSCEDVQASEQTKLKYLARKLLEDLEDGEKIIVRKSNRGITADEMGALLQGVRRYGNCPLLIVTEAEERQTAGIVKSLGNGLYHGNIRRLAPYENAWDGSIEGWREVCSAMIAQL